MPSNRALASGRRPAARVRPSRARRLKVCLAVLALAAAALLLLDRFTHHPGETVIVLMVPALAALLRFGWPNLPRPVWWQYAIYGGVLIAVMIAAQSIVAHIARGRVLPMEVFWAVWFVVAWRLAWAAWSLTIGRLGERWRRWARRMRRSAGGLLHLADPDRRRLAAAALLVRPTRALLVVLIFFPLVFGSLVHRFKIGNPVDLRGYGNLPLEEVRFATDDGLTLSGWFLPEPGAHSTVMICHGAGANKHNFIDFLLLFRGQGYNSLIFDFRGHGESDGHTCTFGLFETADVKAAVDWLKRERPGQARHVYGLGSSMGAMALVRQAAVDVRIEAVILDSCFAAAQVLADDHLGRLPIIGPLLARLVLASFSFHAGRSFWSLDAREAIAALSPGVVAAASVPIAQSSVLPFPRRPVLLIHGEDDNMISPAHMDILYQHANEPKDKWLGPGPHSNVLSTDFHEYRRRVIEFLRGTERERGGQ